MDKWHIRILPKMSENKYTKLPARVVAAQLQWSVRLNAVLALTLGYALWSCWFSPLPAADPKRPGAGSIAAAGDVVMSDSVWAKEVSAVLRTDRDHLTALLNTGGGGVDLHYALFFILVINLQSTIFNLQSSISIDFFFLLFND